MKSFLAFGVLSLSLLAGCNGPITAYQDPNMPLQVSVSDYWMQQEIRVTPHVERIPGTGQLKVSVQVFNTTDKDLSLDYKYWFTDKAGIQVDTIDSGWEFQRIPAKGYQNLTFTSMSAAAEDFRVQIRPAH
ncbi:MAG TPA: YcfL family protein [Phycisphaerae bacterium]|jgi:uncharacterized protein YcfL